MVTLIVGVCRLLAALPELPASFTRSDLSCIIHTLAVLIMLKYGLLKFQQLRLVAYSTTYTPQIVATCHRGSHTPPPAHLLPLACHPSLQQLTLR